MSDDLTAQRLSTSREFIEVMRRGPLILRFPLATVLTALLLLLPAARSARAEDAKNTAGGEFFETKIRPVLVRHCFKCHGAKVAAPKGGLRLDSRRGLRMGGDSGAVLVPGKPNESLLLSALKYDELEMPPQGKLPAQVVADFERWIQMGAVDPRADEASASQKTIDLDQAAKFWAFQRPRRQRPPQVTDVSWPRSAIDRFVLAKLDAHGLAPRPPADRRTLMRRAYFDLIGLPPTPAEIREFVQDRSPHAFAKVVDRLLDSPHYGERWARHWLDIARYGEDQAHTFKARNYPRGYYYRDWVVEAFNDDLPYDEFIRHQIAGDLIDGPKRHQRLAALGLFALGPVYYAENVERAKAIADEWDDRVDTLTRGVLGFTIACARCHDHKYDPFTTSDYYGLAGIFASTQYQERPIVADATVQAKRDAEKAVRRQQLVIDRFLAPEARSLRSALVTEISRYIVAAWKVLNRRKVDPKDKKLLGTVAQQDHVSEFLLKRWVDYLSSPANGNAAERSFLSEWFRLLTMQDPQTDLSSNVDALAEVQSVAAAFQAVIESKAARREELFRQYGENVAFVNESDRADVVPGVIPLGNLFDDSAHVSLHGAIASDRFQATADKEDLGIDRVIQGWGNEAEIAPGVKFGFVQLGSDGRSSGGVVNDGGGSSGGLETRGRKSDPKTGRTEQGIGLHANALVTFDLDELRHAGLMPYDQEFVFKVDRAGMNDDVFGSESPSVHLAVIVSQPHRNKAVFDAVIAGYVNGARIDVDLDDFTYYFNGEIPKPLTADGRFVEFTIPIPAEAKHLTLVCTGAGQGDKDDTISKDRAVFSGARLEFGPRSDNKAAIVAPVENVKVGPDAQPQDRHDAVLLSRLFYDEGLLALPVKEAEGRLPSESTARLNRLKNELARHKQRADAIKVPLAHSLVDGKGTDLPIYIQGNPNKHGALTLRSMPAIFTGGKQRPFHPRGSGRLELARAITSPGNPVTARVIVNRVWAVHFGQGIVRTLSNFGQLGERPSHPALLDDLAVRFMERGWSLKRLHRDIMLSSTYQQSSAFDADQFEIDPDNKFLWRINPRRLEIEPWRDGMLAVTGELDEKLGGPSVDLAATDNKRRTIYGSVSRHKLNELLRLFDFPDPNITSAGRSVTTVPLQQLFVLNSEFMIQRARALASRLRNDVAGSDEDRIQYAFLLLYGRGADEEDINLGREFLSGQPSVAGLPQRARGPSVEKRLSKKQADVAAQAPKDQAPHRLSPWEQYSLILLGANEFLYVD